MPSKEHPHPCLKPFPIDAEAIDLGSRAVGATLYALLTVSSLFFFIKLPDKSVIPVMKVERKSSNHVHIRRIKKIGQHTNVLAPGVIKDKLFHI